MRSRTPSSSASPSPSGMRSSSSSPESSLPTVSDSDAVSVETFLLDFDGDLYGKRIRLEFCRRLRAERRFDSPRQLKDEIERNVAQTRAYFGEMGE